MSVARIHHVAKSRKPQRCGRGHDIEVGQPYLWFTVGYRGRKQSRCTLPEHAPTMSERESSRVSEVYAAIETAEQTVGSLAVETPEDAADFESEVQSALSEVGDTAQEVADDYRAADEQFGGGGMTDSGERADALDEVVSEAGSWSSPGDAFCSDHEGWAEGCDACESAVEDIRQSALEHLLGLSL